ncbi:nuclear transport factor 2 family protein [Flagellimonas sp. CMM7]|uniref:nuclear transport factor 2 family protein n=1 Tax=Flagellimonas sp. CMM7 TaxID=2654676 RepID=UPI0013D548EE|nr:nuclear transport factor 2 family protein [Flagellimonas sp. CMM7]UII79090.1 nuclear transport factor 2 family protein [Flagellimonas sp. CMM7]
MKSYKFSFLYIFIFMWFSTACENQSQKLEAEQKEELITAIDRFNLAFANSEISVLESMVTNNYSHTNGTYEAIDKESWFQYLNKRDKEIEAGILTINSYEMKQLKVEFHDNTAIATAKVITSITKNGELSKNEYRVTNIWVYENGAWKRAGFHDGKIQ